MGAFSDDKFDLEPQRVKELVDSGATRKLLPHGLGHSLGVQVHGDPEPPVQVRAMQAAQVFTTANPPRPISSASSMPGTPRSTSLICRPAQDWALRTSARVSASRGQVAACTGPRAA
mgnify:CR=1 FL=1